MDSWYESLASRVSLASSAAEELDMRGFTVIPGPADPSKLQKWADVYDVAVSAAAPDDVKVGGSTTRVKGLVGCDGELDELYLFPPLLDACCRTIQQPFKLSTLLARTLRPRTAQQSLHVDFASDPAGWPMVGFIFMIDEFRSENGATCFVPGSQGKAVAPTSPSLVPACGPAGSLIVFNGSVWHGHGRNETDQIRRSIQGAFIRRTAFSADNLLGRMPSETLHRLSPLAKYLLAI